jgi:uncharacterized protein (DUF1810 family)
LIGWLIRQGRHRDPFDLQRFLEAQSSVYSRVLDELRRGRKQTHWMWFIFPQLAGLGRSAMAQRFAISSRREAVAYVKHAVLGARLKECTALVNAIEGGTILDSLSSPDDFKFQSSMTLFGAVSSDPEFAVAVSKFYAGRPDQATIDLLAVNHGLSAAGCGDKFCEYTIFGKRPPGEAIMGIAKEGAETVTKFKDIPPWTANSGCGARDALDLMEQGPTEKPDR